MRIADRASRGAIEGERNEKGGIVSGTSLYPRPSGALRATKSAVLPIFRTRNRIQAPSPQSQRAGLRSTLWDWRRGRDSNPRTLAGQRFSSPVQPQTRSILRFRAPPKIKHLAASSLWIVSDNCGDLRAMVRQICTKPKQKVRCPPSRSCPSPVHPENLPRSKLRISSALIWFGSEGGVSPELSPASGQPIFRALLRGPQTVPSLVATRAPPRPARHPRDVCRASRTSAQPPASQARMPSRASAWPRSPRVRSRSSRPRGFPPMNPARAPNRVSRGCPRVTPSPSDRSQRTTTAHFVPLAAFNHSGYPAYTPIVMPVRA